MLRLFKILRLYILMGAVAAAMSLCAAAETPLPVTGDSFNWIIPAIAGIAVVGFILVIILTRPKKKDTDNKDGDDTRNK